VAFPVQVASCGAVSGAIMGINLVAGRNSPTESIEVSYALTQKLISLFESPIWFHQLPPIDRFADLATEAGQQYFMENHLMEHVCNMLRRQQGCGFTYC